MVTPSCGRTHRSYNFIANFFLLATFRNVANRAHINSHSVGLPSTRTMIPLLEGIGLKVVGSISLRRHIAATSVHDLHPTWIRRIGSIDPRIRSGDVRVVSCQTLNLQFGSLRDEAQ
jgi:hypothetical protein